MSQPRLIVRIALFSALIYVLSWGTSFLPNINFIFFIVFLAGFLWGTSAGMLVGGIGMGIWTAFNPYGPAPLPVMVAQIVGAALSGVVGGWFRRSGWKTVGKGGLRWRLVAAAVFCTLLFYLPVNAVDAYLFQPFLPRFIGGALWALISLGFNAVIFPLLFPATRYLYVRESVNQ